MILTCPSCGTQYVVKDGAIPPGGRQVRCASCKHSWHEDPDEIGAPQGALGGAALESEPGATAEANDAAGLDEANPDDEGLAEAVLIEPRSGPEAEERAYEEAVVADAQESGQAESAVDDRPAAAPDWREPPVTDPLDDEFSPFPTAADVNESRRRNPLLVILLVILAVAVIAAAFWFFALPEWKVRLGLTAAGASPLALVTTHMDRQRLESGNELLTVTGRVINPTAKDQDVPPLQAQLRSRTGQVVYKWTIAPPVRTLPPGGSASFNSAEVSVPPGGDELTITVGSPNA